MWLQASHGEQIPRPAVAKTGLAFEELRPGKSSEMVLRQDARPTDFSTCLAIVYPHVCAWFPGRRTFTTTTTGLYICYAATGPIPPTDPPGRKPLFGQTIAITKLVVFSQ